MNPDLDTLATRLYVTIDDLLVEHPQWAPERPAVGIAPKLTDAELVTLAVIQALLGFTSEARFIRYARIHLTGLFPYLPQRPAYNKRLRHAAVTMQHIIATLARDCPSWHDDLWLVDSTPVECGRSRETVKRSDMAGYATYGYCASHSRYFWGLRLHLIATPSGLPVAYALTGAKTDERDTALAMIELDPELDARSGQILMADKGYRSAAFEAELNARGITLIRPTIKSEKIERPLARFLKPFRQIIESINQTLKRSSISNATAVANPPASAHAFCNDSSLSPPRSGKTKPAAPPAPHDHSSPTTTDTPWNQSSSCGCRTNRSPCSSPCGASDRPRATTTSPNRVGVPRSWNLRQSGVSTTGWPCPGLPSPNSWTHSAPVTGGLGPRVRPTRPCKS